CYDHYPGIDPEFRQSFQYAILLHIYDQTFPWPEKEAEVMRGGSSVLGPLLRRIESVEPGDFADVGDLYQFLLHAAT
ncbi:MAG TPA: hypothetical protein VF221_15275, partial [Chloroflexota bacterium]